MFKAIKRFFSRKKTDSAKAAPRRNDPVIRNSAKATPKHDVTSGVMLRDSRRSNNQLSNELLYSTQPYVSDDSHRSCASSHGSHDSGGGHHSSYDGGSSHSSCDSGSSSCDSGSSGSWD